MSDDDRDMLTIFSVLCGVVVTIVLCCVAQIVLMQNP